MNGNDTSKVVALLEGHVQDLKAYLAEATTEKAHLLELANNLQKQNEVLMLTSPKNEKSYPNLDDIHLFFILYLAKYRVKTARNPLSFEG